MAETKIDDGFNGLNKEYGAILRSLVKTLQAIEHRLQTDIFGYTMKPDTPDDKISRAKEMSRRVKTAIRVLKGEPID